MRVLLWSIAGAIAVYALLIAGVAWLLAQAWVRDLPLLGALGAWSGSLAAVVVATLLFPGVVTALVGLFLESVAAAVEVRHYPHLPPAREVPVSEALSTSARLAVATIGINIILLPLYLVLFFLPPLNLIVYYAVNGRLLGREYFETVALRRMTPDEVKNVRQQHTGTLWFTGAVTAVLLTVPILNIIAPVIGAAAMVHVVQKLTRTS